jgi:arylsulfatase
MNQAVPRLLRRDFLRAAAGGAFLAGAAARAQTATLPNIVVILCDDLGYGDIHCYGSGIPTPNIDEMAHEGVRFEQFYSANAVCSPSRASLMTGRYPTRVGVPDVVESTDTTGLSLAETTIAEMLKPSGYSTMCVGKWHLGATTPYLPTSRGFDHYWGIPYSNDQLPSILLQDTTIIESPVQLNTLTQRYTQQAVSFIQRSKNSPFFLYFAHTFPHIPLAVSTAFQGSTGMGLYADVVAEIDASVGTVLQALKDNGVDNNTLTIFTSDNGPWFLGSPGKLRGRKGWTYEGGVREPFIARFPGRIPAAHLPARTAAPPPGATPPTPSASVHLANYPAARVVTSMATMMDILPTIAGLSNAKLPGKPLDGVDIWPVLTGEQDAVKHDMFLYFDSWNVQCARLGPWKLHIARYNDFAWNPDPPGGRINLPLPAPELYNLEVDPDESYDVAADNPTVVADIQARIVKALPSFPAGVMNAWTATMSLKSSGFDGGLPALVPPQPPQ